MEVKRLFGTYWRVKVCPLKAAPSESSERGATKILMIAGAAGDSLLMERALRNASLDN